MKFLIVSLRYFGDCFLSASLAPAIKKRLPGSIVDILTYRGNEKVLEGCGDVDHVLTIEKNTNIPQFLKRFYSNKNLYDWALITQESTRAILAGFWLARRQVKHDCSADHRSWWKEWLISYSVSMPNGHFLDRQSALLRPILGAVSPLDPVTIGLDSLLPEDVTHFCLSPYVVCHPFSRYADKNWSEKEWIYLIEKIVHKGYSVALTGGPQKEEELALEAILQALPPGKIVNLAGRLSFTQTTKLIAASALYVGVDTVTSHLAAASGARSICLFGPTDVCVWGPSPAHDRQPYDAEHSVQDNGNVTVVRNPKYLSCHQCRSHRCALNAKNPQLGLCMQEISARWIWSIIEHKKLL